MDTQTDMLTRTEVEDLAREACDHVLRKVGLALGPASENEPPIPVSVAREVVREALRAVVEESVIADLVRRRE